MPHALACPCPCGRGGGQVMVVGDVHGQYFDLLNILKRWRPDHNLLFLGDYVGEPPSRIAISYRHTA